MHYACVLGARRGLAYIFWMVHVLSGLPLVPEDALSLLLPRPRLANESKAQGCRSANPVNDQSH